MWNVANYSKEQLLLVVYIHWNLSFPTFKQHMFVSLVLFHHHLMNYWLSVSRSFSHNPILLTHILPVTNASQSHPIYSKSLLYLSFLGWKEKQFSTLEVLLNDQLSSNTSENVSFLKCCYFNVKLILIKCMIPSTSKPFKTGRPQEWVVKHWRQLRQA